MWQEAISSLFALYYPTMHGCQKESGCPPGLMSLCRNLTAWQCATTCSTARMMDASCATKSSQSLTCAHTILPSRDGPHVGTCLVICKLLLFSYCICEFRPFLQLGFGLGRQSWRLHIGKHLPFIERSKKENCA